MVVQMEEWKVIDRYPCYSVSNLGRVKSHARVVIRNGHEMHLKETILKPGKMGKCGHRFVNLRKDRRATSFYVHRLVALAFIGDQPDGKPQVAHWDGDPSNNHVSNLRWASASENSQDSIRLGRNKRPSGTKSKKAIFSDFEILEIYRMYSEGFSLRSIARKFDTGHNVVGSLLRQKSYKNDCDRIGLRPVLR